jgi:competence protein ComEC
VDLNRTQYYVGTVTEVPAGKPSSIKVTVEIIAAGRPDSIHPASGRMIAYVRPTRVPLRAANVILFSGRAESPRKPMNPGEFDYRQYLSDRGILHTIFVDSTQLVVLPFEAGLNPVWRFGLTCREAVLDRIASSDLSADAVAICSALLTGYDARIEPEVRSAFAHSGTLHVLSVSGLHTGLIYLVLGFLFDRLDRDRSRKVLRFVVITAGLWLFALVAGFAAPVLRAVIMFNLMGAGTLFVKRGRSDALNILFCSAFLLLCYRPQYLRDTGFLLSYAAMGGLLCVQPRLARAWQPTGFPRYIWQSVTASVAATVTTLPFTLFFFRQFPIWFFLTNLVVVPLSFLILMLTLTLIWPLPAVPFLLNGLVEFMIRFINFFDSPVYGYVADLNFGILDAVLCAVVTVLIGHAISERSPRAALGTLLMLAFWQTIGFWEFAKNAGSSDVVVFDAGKATAIAVRQGPMATVHASAAQTIDRYVRPVLARMNARTSEGAFNYCSTNSGGMLVLDSAGKMPSLLPTDVKTLIVCNNFALSAKLLETMPALSTVIADGSSRRRVKAQNRKVVLNAGLNFYDTSEDGMFLAKAK